MKEEIREEKKKVNIKMIIAIVAAAAVVITIISVVLYNQNVAKLQEQWKDKPKLAGDFCINVLYYTKLIEEEIDTKNQTNTQAQQRKEELLAFEKEIDTQANELKEVYKQLGKPKAQAQKDFQYLYTEAMSLYSKMGNVTDKYIGYYAMLWIGGRATKTQTEIAINEVYDIYKDNIIHKLVYNTENEELTERKEIAEDDLYYEETKEFIKDKYGW